MNRIILASHGGLSAGMKDTVQMILGELPNLYALATLRDETEPITVAARRLLEGFAAEDAVYIVTDVMGGSVNNEMKYDARACQFNMGTGCVELLLRDGRKISINCTGVEDALDVTMAQRSELDYLIYNDPLAYAELILNGEPEEYLRNAAGSHGLED